MAVVVWTEGLEVRMAAGLGLDTEAKGEDEETEGQTVAEECTARRQLSSMGINRIMLKRRFLSLA